MPTNLVSDNLTQLRDFSRVDSFGISTDLGLLTNWGRQPGDGGIFDWEICSSGAELLDISCDGSEA